MKPFLYLGGRDVENVSNFGIQLLDIGESMNSACGASMSQLRVENKPRPRVFRRPRWWWWRRRKRRRCGLHTPLTVALGLVSLHGLCPSGLGVLRAHSVPALHLFTCLPPLWTLLEQMLLHKETNTDFPPFSYPTIQAPSALGRTALMN